MSVLLSFQSFEAIPLSKTPERVLVRWKITPNRADLTDYEFYVDRGDAPDQSKKAMNLDIDGKVLTPAITLVEANNLAQLAGPISALDFYEYVDYTANFWDFYHVQNYRIRCRRISTQEEISTPIFTIEGELDVVGIYIADEKNFILEDSVGEPSFVYRKRRQGVVCTNCFDPIQKSRLTSYCTVCYGTNWEGGFHQELQAFVDYSPSIDEITIRDWGAIQPNEIDAELSNWPQINPGDVLRELRRQRMWRVSKVRGTEKRRVSLLQFVRLVEVNPKDIEYAIPYSEEKALPILAEFEKARQRREF